MHLKRTWYFIAALLFFAMRLGAQLPAIPLQYQLQYNGNSIHVQFTYLPQEKDNTVFNYGDFAFGGIPAVHIVNSKQFMQHFKTN